MSPSTLPTQTGRRPTAIDAVLDAYVDELAGLDPYFATTAGIAGHDDEVTDYSPAFMDARAAAARAALARVEALEPENRIDVVSAAAFRERIGVELELHAALLSHSLVNNIASPLQDARQVYDLMPTATDADWAVIATRLGRLERSLDSWIESLHHAAEHGVVSARRQVELAADEARALADPEAGFFAELAARTTTSAGAGAVSGESEPPRVRIADETGRLLAENVARAQSAYARLADALADLAPRARTRDAIGREAYALLSRSFLGARIDLEETYAWGLSEVTAIIAEQERVAHEVEPGASISTAKRILNDDPTRAIESTDALAAWMQELSDRAVAELGQTHFEIPETISTLECRIATTGSGAIYYTPPSEDLSRPGRMWWDVPHGVTEFRTWQETTTVYHEGVPGHHLQFAQTILAKDQLNRWRRVACWVSGHGEGWALYAERLMVSLGYLDDPGDRMGMLDAQRMRAGRVVVDIGMHLELEAPDEVGGGTWDYDKAVEFMTTHWGIERAHQDFELNRYLGWPGQAPSYKVGQRFWEQIRDARAAQGPGGELDRKSFHREALEVGSLGLDVLRDALLS